MDQTPYTRLNELKYLPTALVEFVIQQNEDLFAPTTHIGVIYDYCQTPLEDWEHKIHLYLATR